MLNNILHCFLHFLYVSKNLNLHHNEAERITHVYGNERFKKCFKSNAMKQNLTIHIAQTLKISYAYDWKF